MEKRKFYNFDKDVKSEEDSKKENERADKLTQKLDEILLSRQVISQVRGKKFKIGIISDTHIGSIYENPAIVESLYKVFKNRRVDAIYHAGDMLDGFNMFKGHEFEVHALSLDEQVKLVVNNYPHIEGVNTYFITGSHDLSWHKKVGLDPGDLIIKDRPDLKYLGREERDIELCEGIIFRLFHPGKGAAYALSYHPQKYADSLSGGRKPNILVIGHYHKAEHLPCYRNMDIIQAGCTQSQSPFMRRNNLAAHLGGWILEGRIDREHLLSGFKGEFIAFYEEELRK